MSGPAIPPRPPTKPDRRPVIPRRNTNDNAGSPSPTEASPIKAMAALLEAQGAPPGGIGVGGTDDGGAPPPIPVKPRVASPEAAGNDGDQGVGTTEADTLPPPIVMTKPVVVGKPAVPPPKPAMPNGPDQTVWIEYWSEDHQHPYFFCEATNLTVWVRPETGTIVDGEAMLAAEVEAAEAQTEPGPNAAGDEGGETSDGGEDDGGEDDGGEDSVSDTAGIRIPGPARPNIRTRPGHSGSLKRRKLPPQPKARPLHKTHSSSGDIPTYDPANQDGTAPATPSGVADLREDPPPKRRTASLSRKKKNLDGSDGGGGGGSADGRAVTGLNLDEVLSRAPKPTPKTRPKPRSKRNGNRGRAGSNVAPDGAAPVPSPRGGDGGGISSRPPKQPPRTRPAGDAPPPRATKPRGPGRSGSRGPPPPLPERTHPLIPIDGSTPPPVAERRSKPKVRARPKVPVRRMPSPSFAQQQFPEDEDPTKRISINIDMAPVAIEDDDDFSLDDVLAHIERIKAAAAQAVEAEVTPRFSQFEPAPDAALDLDEDGLVYSEAPGANGFKTITSASPENLLERATFEREQDPDLPFEFVVTHKSYFEDVELMDKLVERYMIQPGEEMTQAEAEQFVRTVQIPIRLKTFILITLWIQQFPHDFVGPNELRNTLDDFIERILPAMGLQQSADQLQEVLSKETRDAMMLDLPDPIPEYDSLTSIDWKRIPVRTLAEHICHIEYQLFRRIRPRELLGCRWSKKNGPEVSPNVRNMIDWFNKVSRWVITEIVSERNRRARVDVVSRFIDIAMEMRHLGNFNGICEITAGLTTIDVKRLKKTWTGVSSERENILRFLCDLLSRDRSYKNYRQVIHSVGLPAIPYLGVYLTDLTFLHDGNDDLTADGLVFMSKHRGIATVIGDLQRFQSVSYAVDIDPGILVFLHKGIVVMEEKESYAMSKEIEPPSK